MNNLPVIAWLTYTKEDGTEGYRALKTWADVDANPDCKVKKEYRAVALKRDPDRDKASLELEQLRQENERLKAREFYRQRSKTPEPSIPSSEIENDLSLATHSRDPLQRIWQRQEWLTKAKGLDDN